MVLGERGLKSEKIHISIHSWTNGLMGYGGWLHYKCKLSPESLLCLHGVKTLKEDPCQMPNTRQHRVLGILSLQNRELNKLLFFISYSASDIL